MWAQFCRFRRISPRFRTDSSGWGEPFLDFLRCGYKLMAISHSGLANRYYDVRYMHLISGGSGLTLHEFRIKAPLKALKRKSTRRENPFFCRFTDLASKQLVCGKWKFRFPCLCVMCNSVGILLIGISEIQNLRHCDISFFREDAARLRPAGMLEGPEFTGANLVYCGISIDRSSMVWTSAI